MRKNSRSLYVEILNIPLHLKCSRLASYDGSFIGYIPVFATSVMNEFEFVFIVPGTEETQLKSASVINKRNVISHQSCLSVSTETGESINCNN